MKLTMFFLIACTVLLAQPSIVVVPEMLESEMMGVGMTRFHGYPSEPIYIKNTGTETVELGLSAEWTYRVVDSVDAARDTVRMWGYFSDTLADPPLGDTMDYILETPRFSSEGFYGSAGLSLAPGDSVFLSYKITLHYFFSVPTQDTSQVFIYARSGAEIDTVKISQELFVMWPGMPPVDSLVIDSISATAGSEQISMEVMAAPFDYGVDWFHVYRDTTAFFYSTQLDSSKLLPERLYSTAYVDSFSDTLWEDYWMSSKGIEDTLVNLFYVCTSVDSGPTAPGSFAESSYLSWCVCEYDQSLKSHPIIGSVNLISIPCYDERYTTASDLGEFGIHTVQEWNPITQAWSLRGSNILPGVWFPDEPLQVSHVYRLSGADMDAFQLFSTFKPGIIPQNDTSYVLHSNGIRGGRNIIMLPFKVAYIDNIIYCSDLENSLVAAGAYELYRVERWNNTTQTWSVVGEKLFMGWISDGRLRPGMPYRISIDVPVPIYWPVS